MVIGIFCVGWQLQPFLSHVLSKIFDYSGYTATGPVLNDVDLNKLIFYSVVSLDIQPDGYLDEKFIIASSQINVADHLPDMTAAELLNAYRNLLCFGYFFDTTSNSVQLVFLKDIINAPTQKDWTSKLVTGYTKEQKDQTGFTLAFTLDSNDDLTKENPDTKQIPDVFKPFIFGDGEKKLDVKLSSLIIDQSGPYTLPHASQRAKSSFYELKDTTFAPRLLFWNGLQADNFGKNFPAASNQSGSYQLQWNGPDGLYERFHKDWMIFQENTAPIEMEFDLDIFDLQTIDMKEKIYVAGQNYLIGKISVTLPLNGPVKMILYKI